MKAAPLARLPPRLENCRLHSSSLAHDQELIPGHLTDPDVNPGSALVTAFSILTCAEG